MANSNIHSNLIDALLNGTDGGYVVILADGSRWESNLIEWSDAGLNTLDVHTTLPNGTDAILIVPTERVRSLGTATVAVRSL